jgi:hypothetical protein
VALENHLVIMVDDVDLSLLRGMSQPFSMMESWGINVLAGSNPLYHPSLPVLEELATRSLRFQNARAMPVCSSTRACMLTGLYPGGLVKDGSFQEGHGVGSVGPIPNAKTENDFGPTGAGGPTGVPTIVEFGDAPHAVKAYSKWVAETFPGQFEDDGVTTQLDTQRVHFGMGGKYHLAHTNLAMLEPIGVGQHTQDPNDIPPGEYSGWGHIAATLGPEAKHSLVFTNLHYQISPNPAGAAGDQGNDAYYNYRTQKFDYGAGEFDQTSDESRALDGAVEHTDATYASHELEDWIVRRQFDDCREFARRTAAMTGTGHESWVYHLHASFAHNPYSKAPESLIYDTDLYGSAAVTQEISDTGGDGAAARSQMGRLQAFDNELGRFLKLLAGLTESDTVTAALDVLGVTTNIYILGDNGGEATIWRGFKDIGDFRAAQVPPLSALNLSQAVEQNLADSGLNYSHTTGHFKRSVSETGSRIPMMVFGPMVADSLRGKITRAMVDTVDIPATVAARLSGDGDALATWHAHDDQGNWVSDGVSFVPVCTGDKDHTDHARQWSLTERYWPWGARENTQRSMLGFTYWYPESEGGDGGLYKLIRRTNPWAGAIGDAATLQFSNSAGVQLDPADAGEYFFHLQNAGTPDAQSIPYDPDNPAYFTELAGLNMNSPDPWELFTQGQRRTYTQDINWSTGTNYAPDDTEKAAYAYGLNLLEGLLNQLSFKYVECLDPGEPATGFVPFTGNPADTDTLTVSDGATSITFEFDLVPVSVTGGNVSVAIGVDLATTLATLKVEMNAQVWNVTCLQVTEAGVVLQNDSVGVLGNVAITESSTAIDPPTGMAGGRDAETIQLFLNSDLSLPYLDEMGELQSLPADAGGATITYVDETGTDQTLTIQS